MTYRLVTQRWLRAAQFATLFVTAVVGASISVTPRSTDSKLTVIEQTMNADYWAAALIVLSLVALICEIDMTVRKHERWMNVAVGCHILLCGLLVGYSAAALAGVLVRVAWNFGAPSIGLLMAFWHLVFIKRRPRV